MAAIDHPTKFEQQKYDDFDIEIGLGADQVYPVTIRSRTGGIRTSLHFPYDALALENHLQALQIVLLRSRGARRRVFSREEANILKFGQALFEALFNSDVRSLYEVNQREATRQSKGLRIKLNIQSAELAALPWEFVYDTRQGDYLVLARSTPIVRTIDLPQPVEPLSVTPPLRILGMVAAPKDLPGLDITREKAWVARAISRLQGYGLVELVWVEGQTWRDLQRAMRNGSWHIFHFIGHGDFDPRSDEGMIALADETGQMDQLSATQLGRLLADHPSLRLVLLNSCAGAQSSRRDIFSSTAATLVRRNIPAVLAMQYEISDQAAIEFAQTFYEALADGLTLVAAVTEARIALSMAVDNCWEWGTPVLYMRGMDGVLFVVQPATPTRLVVSTSPQPTLVKTTVVSHLRQISPVGLLMTIFIALSLGLLLYFGFWHEKNTDPTTVFPASATATLLTSAPAMSPNIPTEAPMADITLLLQQGEDALTNGQFTQALGFFQQVLTVDPKNFQALFGAGRAYAKMGQPNQAVQNFKKALAIDPDHVATLYNLALVYNYQLRDHTQALTLINQAMALNPTEVDYIVTRGKIYTLLGQRDSAEADFKAAIGREPRSWLHYADRAEFYTRFQEYDNAIADYSKAIELAPVQGFLYYQRAELYRLYKNDTDRARADYQQYLARVNQSRADVEQFRRAQEFVEQGGGATPIQSAASTSATSVLLHSSLDNRVAIEHPAIGIGGHTSLQATDFISGQQRQGAQFTDGKKYIVFPVMQDEHRNINLAQGEMEFWYKPNYNAGDDDLPHVLMVVGDYYQRPRLLLVEQDRLTFSMLTSDFDSGREARSSWRAPLWQANQWVQIRAVWNAMSHDDAMQIYVNGQRVDEGCQACGWNPVDMDNASITIGAANRAGEALALGVIDELVIRGPMR